MFLTRVRDIVKGYFWVFLLSMIYVLFGGFKVPIEKMIFFFPSISLIVWSVSFLFGGMLYFLSENWDEIFRFFFIVIVYLMFTLPLYKLIKLILPETWFNLATKDPVAVVVMMIVYCIYPIVFYNWVPDKAAEKGGEAVAGEEIIEEQAAE